MGAKPKHLHQCNPRQQRSWALGNKTPLPSSCHTCPGLFTPAATYSPETKMPPCLETDEDPLRSLDMIRIWIYQKHCLLWDAEIARCISIRGIGASSESITCILKSDGYLMLPQWIWSSPKRSALWIEHLRSMMDGFPTSHTIGMFRSIDQKTWLVFSKNVKFQPSGSHLVGHSFLRRKSKMPFKQPRALLKASCLSIAKGNPEKTIQLTNLL